MYHRLYYSLPKTKIEGEDGNHSSLVADVAKKLGSSKVKLIRTDCSANESLSPDKYLNNLESLFPGYN